MCRSPARINAHNSPAGRQAPGGAAAISVHSRASASICVLPCFLANRSVVSASGHPCARDALSQQQRLGHRSSEGGYRQSNVRVFIVGELAALELPRLQNRHKRGRGYGENSFSGAVPRERTAAEEIASLLAVLREAGRLP